MNLLLSRNRLKSKEGLFRKHRRRRRQREKTTTLHVRNGFFGISVERLRRENAEFQVL